MPGRRAEVDEHPVAFAGMSDSKLEMLFVRDSARGRGIGSMLLRHAIDAQGVRRVDVNEQNPAAVEFYRRKGFVRTGRSARDDAGRPYPILN